MSIATDFPIEPLSGTYKQLSMLAKRIGLIGNLPILNLASAEAEKIRLLSRAVRDNAIATDL